MIVLELNNNQGMGNQFFLYAYAYALAKRENQKITIFSRMNHPYRKYVLDLFQLDKACVNKVYRLDGIHNHLVWRGASWAGKHVHKLLKYKYFCIREEENRVYKEIPCGLADYWVKGNFECYRYFHAYREDLRKQFVYFPEIQKETKKILEIIDKDSYSVAMHIRRGDFTNANRCVPLKFYERAIEFFLNIKDKHYCFYLACEDASVIRYFQKYENVISIEIHKGENKDIETWICLAHCKNHIVTNSTYSWWAAYLADAEKGDVVTLSKELYGRLEDNKKGYEEFYLPNWIPIEL